MEQPDTTVLDSDAAVPAPEPEAQQGDPEIDEALLDDEQQADEDDDVEDDLDGVKLRGKKDAVARLRAERLMQADYTRKMQAGKAELATERQLLQAEKAESAARTQMFQSHLNVVAKLVSLDEKIAAFDGVDWDRLTDADPVQAMKLDRQHKNILAQKQQELQNLDVLRQQFALDKQRTQQTQQQGFAKQLEQAAAVLAREVPNWEKRDQTIASTR